jgi:hypothetical protein
MQSYQEHTCDFVDYRQISKFFSYLIAGTNHIWIRWWHPGFGPDQYASSEGRYVTPLAHIILIPSQIVFNFAACLTEKQHIRIIYLSSTTLTMIAPLWFSWYYGIWCGEYSFNLYTSFFHWTVLKHRKTGKWNIKYVPSPINIFIYYIFTCFWHNFKLNI